MSDIIIHEVGMRDGLQMEKKTVPTETKIQWLEIILESGIDIFQLGSFVNPEKVPQMADTEELFNHFNQPGRKPDNVTFSALVLNEKGLERGMKCGVEMFCLGVSASETHSKKNTGKNIDENLSSILKMVRNAMDAGKKVQTSVQSAFGCGFEGEIPEDRVLGIVKQYIDAGVKVISLADTAGYAKPDQVKRLYHSIRELDKDVELACHFHNTFGMGLANSLTALKCGVKYYETSFAGLGGCPFTKSPVGNIASENFVQTVQAKNHRKDINNNILFGMAKIVNYYFKRELPGHAFKF